MKRLLLLMLLALPLAMMGQEITTEIDDFTGDKIVSTSWERIYRGGGTARLQTRMKLMNVNGTNIVSFRIFTDAACSSNKGNLIMLKTDKDIVRLKNAEYAISGPGEYSNKPVNGKLGIYLKCGGNFSSLSTDKVQKIRFYFNDGYREIELKEKESDKLLEIFKKFNDAIN